MCPCFEDFFFLRWRQKSRPLHELSGVEVGQDVERRLLKRARLPSRAKSLLAADPVYPLILWLGQPEREIASEGVQNTIRLQSMLVQELLRDPSEGGIGVRRALAGL